MPIYTGPVKALSSWDFPQGTKYRFWILSSAIGRPVFTWDSWKASLCDRAERKGLRVVMETRQTRFDDEIVHVALADAPAEEVA